MDASTEHYILYQTKIATNQTPSETDPFSRDFFLPWLMVDQQRKQNEKPPKQQQNKQNVRLQYFCNNNNKKVRILVYDVVLKKLQNL